MKETRDVIQINGANGIDRTVADWAANVSIDQIPALIVVLFARLVTGSGRRRGHEEADHDRAEKLLTAGELAQHLRLPESFIRTHERQGRLPSVRAGRYVRFRLTDVERALAERERRKP